MSGFPYGDKFTWYPWFGYKQHATDGRPTKSTWVLYHPVMHSQTSLLSCYTWAFNYSNICWHDAVEQDFLFHSAFPCRMYNFVRGTCCLNTEARRGSRTRKRCLLCRERKMRTGVNNRPVGVAIFYLSSYLQIWPYSVRKVSTLRINLFLASSTHKYSSFQGH
jgi:hypothetical protein